MSNPRIYLRDETLQRTAEIDDFSSFSATLAFNAAGTWELHVPGTTPEIALGHYSGVVVERDEQTIISGVATSRKRRLNQDGSSTWELFGRTDTIFLEERLAFPSDPPFTASAYDSRTDLGETVLHEYVEENLGANAISGRELLLLTQAPDTGAGTTVTGRGRFHTLLELFQELATAAGGLGFHVIQEGDGLVFAVYEPVDRSADAIFSVELGTLVAYEYEELRPKANYVIVAGAGEGTSRLIQEYPDNTSISAYGRIEAFRDRRDTAISADLDQTGAEVLAESAERSRLSITPREQSDLIFGTDYNLGDKVAVVVDDVTIIDVVREVVYSLSAEGERIKPTIGTNGSDTAPNIFRRVVELDHRLSRQERV